MAAASIRMGTSGRSGYAPSHAARASAKIGGIHRGLTGENCAIGRPASANSGFQSAARTGADAPGRSCDVSTLQRDGQEADQPACSIERQRQHPGTRGVADSDCVTMLVPPIGTNGRGLWRYQKRSAGG